MGDELSRRQAQNGVNFDFEVKFDLEGQGQSPPKTIGILTKVFYTYGPNLVILAWTGDELSRGQTWWRTDGLTDGRTDAGNDNTRRPILASGKNQSKIQTKSIVLQLKKIATVRALTVILNAWNREKSLKNWCWYDQPWTCLMKNGFIIAHIFELMLDCVVDNMKTADLIRTTLKVTQSGVIAYDVLICIAVIRSL